jgi:hypothetical protein
MSTETDNAVAEARLDRPEETEIHAGGRVDATLLLVQSRVNQDSTDPIPAGGTVQRFPSPLIPQEDAMTSPRRSQLHRSLAVGVAAAALAAPAAQAGPILEPGSGSAGQFGAAVGELRTDAAQAGGAKAPAVASSAFRTDAAQAAGAEAPAVAPEPIAVEAPAITTIVDGGFDWGSAAIGAGGGGALILLAMGGLAGVSRIRMRTGTVR